MATYLDVLNRETVKISFSTTRAAVGIGLVPQLGVSSSSELSPSSGRLLGLLEQQISTVHGGSLGFSLS